jgi:hypothetical protein
MEEVVGGEQAGIVVMPLPGPEITFERCMLRRLLVAGYHRVHIVISFFIYVGFFCCRIY